MQTWEYHWVKANDPEELYERIAAEGKHGWELVSVTASAVPTSAAARVEQMKTGRKPNAFHAWFKRPSQAE